MEKLTISLGRIIYHVNVYCQLALGGNLNYSILYVEESILILRYMKCTLSSLSEIIIAWAERHWLGDHKPVQKNGQGTEYYLK